MAPTSGTTSGTTSGAISARAYGLSDIGNGRTNNEDQFLIADLGKFLTVEQSTLSEDEQSFLRTRSNARLLMVADGIGGMAAGDIASNLAVRVLTLTAVRLLDWMDPQDGPDIPEIQQELVAAFRTARERLIESTGRHPEREGMGTTLTAAYLFGDWMCVVHVGDSRCYLARPGKFEQLTTDHTVARQMQEAGAISESAVQRSPFRSVLWNLVGADGEGAARLEPEVATVPIVRGDRILLCTDGLTGPVPDERIQQVMRTVDCPKEAAETLVNDALNGGGGDNVTVVVAFV